MIIRKNICIKNIILIFCFKKKAGAIYGIKHYERYFV